MSNTLISGPASVAEGAPYVVALNAAAQAGASWSLNWGDGSPAQAVPGTATTATHTYAAGPATDTVTASVTGLANPLDTSFGTNGTVQVDGGTSNDVGYGSAVQMVNGQPKLLLAGGPNCTVVRLNADGSLDTTFGNGTGKVTVSGLGAAYGLAVQADGKIVVGGGKYFGVARLNADGSLDTSFGTNGTFAAPINNAAYYAYGLTIQADGKIVLAGNNDNDFVLARFTTAGKLDTTFGSGGRATFDLGSTADHAYAVAQQPDGKLVAVGHYKLGTGSYQLAVARFTTAGQPDSSFGSGGKVLTRIGTVSADANAVAFQPDGSIVVAGSAYVSSTSTRDFALARYTPAGVLDTTFGSNGVVTSDFAGHGDDQAYAVRVLPDGTILAAGHATGTDGADFGLARYNADGSPYVGFGTNGLLTTKVGVSGSSAAESISADASGDLFVGGEANGDFAAAHYWLATTSDAVPVAVNDVPATVTAPAALSNAVGQATALSATFTDPGTAETHAAVVSWGDGTTSAATVTESNGSGTIAATHTYALHGTYQPTLSVTDSGGAVAVAPVAVNVGYVAPALSVTAGQTTVTAGQTVTLRLHDAGPEAPSAVTGWQVVWGDGSAPQAVTSPPDTSNPADAVWTVTHTYTASGTFTASATATDSAGGHAAGTVTFGVAPLLQPSGLTAMAASDAQVNLAWADTNAGLGTGFNVYRSASPYGGTYALLGSVGPGVTSYVDAGLSEGTSYYYEVTATSGGAESAASAAASATTLPTAPTGLSVTSVAGGAVGLSWTNNSAKAAYAYVYELEAGTWAQVGSVALGTSPAGTTSTFAVTGVFSPSSAYLFRVQAYGPGGYSLPSNTVTATTAAFPTAPTGLAATAASDAQVNLTWADNSNNETGFNVYRSGLASGPFTLLGTAAANTAAYADTAGLTEGTTYYYQVTAVNAAGESAATNTYAVTTLPKAPSGLAVTGIGAGQVGFSWTNNSALASSATVYELKAGTWTAIGSVALPASPAGTTGTLAVTTQTFAPSTTYAFRVQASGYPGGTSLPSPIVTATTAAFPQQPSGLSATSASDGRVNLTWTDDSGNEAGFNVYRSTSSAGPFTLLGTAGANATTYADTAGLGEGTTYYYQVTATNAAGESTPATGNATTWETAPTGLAVTAISGGSVSFSWTNASAKATSVYFQQLVSGSWQGFGPYVTVAGAGTGTPQSVTFTSAQVGNQTFAEGTTYTFRVVAYGGYGTPASPAVSTLTGTYPQQPSNLAVAAASDSAVNLSWTDNSGGTAGFTVYRSPTNASGSFVAVGTTAAGVTSFTDAGLAEYTSYYYEVAATNGQGSSPLTGSQGTTTWEKAPTALAVTAISAGSVSFAWTNSSARATSVYFQELVNGSWQGFGPSVAVTPGANSSVTLTSAQTNQAFAASTTYTFRVVASGGYGTPASAAATGTTAAYAQQPSNLSASATSDSQVNLTWTDNSAGTAGFTVYRSTTNATGSFVAVGTTAAGTTSYADTGLAEYTNYYYEVAATNGQGSSPLTGSQGTTTWEKAPTGLSVTAISAGSVSFGWTNSSAKATSVYFQWLVNGSWQGFGPGVNVTAGSTATATLTSAQTNQVFAASTTYAFRVVASGGNGTPASAPASGTTAAYPQQPSNLSASATSDSQVNLTWADASGGTAGFTVYRSTDNSTFTAVGTTAAGVTSYADTGLTEYTNYYYRVAATNGQGASPQTGSQGTTTWMRAPTGLAVTAINAGSVTFSWTNSSAKASSVYFQWLANGNWQGFGPYVTVAGAGSATPQTVTFTSAQTSQTFVAGTTYTFRVIANGGNGTPASAAATGTTSGYPQQPSNLGVSAASDAQVNVTWTDNSGGTAGYTVYRSTDNNTFIAVGTAAAGATSYADTGLAENTSYYYKVVATNAQGNSPPTGSQGTTTWVKAPNALAVTAIGSGSVSFSWINASARATSVYFQELVNGNWQGFGPYVTVVGAGTSTPQTVTFTSSQVGNQTFAAGTAYTFRVVANGTGSPASAAASSVAGTVPQPTNLSASAVSDGQVNLSWTDSSGGTAGFTVYRSTTNGNGSFVPVGTTAAGVTSYADTGLSEGTNYYYQVAATNGQASSPNTGSVGTTTWYQAPTGLSVTSITAGSVGFAWTNASARATSVYFQWLVNGNWQGFGPSVNVTPGSNATATFTSGQTSQTFAAGTTYTFRVVANGGPGTPASAAAGGTTGTYPQQPSNLSVAAASDSLVNLAWTDTSGGTAGFTVYRSTTNGSGSFVAVGTTAAGVTTYADSGLTENTSYYYEVAATNAQGSSPLTGSQGTTTWLKAPTGLAVTAISAGSVGFAWTNSSARATSVYFQQLVNGGWQGFGPGVGVTPGSAGTVTFTSSQTNQTFAAGATYTFRVIANGGNGTPASAAATGTTAAYPQQPSNLAASAVSGGQVNLSWTDNSGGTAGYTVYRSTDNNTFTAVGTAAAGATSYADTGLAEYTSYYYKVAATNTQGSSPLTGSVGTTTWEKAPTNLQVTAISAGSVSFGWTNSSAKATSVYFQWLVNGSWQGFGPSVNVTSGSNATATFTSAQTNQTFSAGATYTFRVIANGGYGTPASVAASGTTGAYPQQPSNLSATAASDSQVNLTWTDNSAGTAGFTVYRSTTNASGSFAAIGTTAAGVTAYADAGLAEYTNYYYEVAATNAQGSSPLAGSVGTTTWEKAPTGLAVTAISAGSVTFSWTNASTKAGSVYFQWLVNGSWQGFGPSVTVTGAGSSNPQTVTLTSAQTNQTFGASSTYTFRVIASGGYGTPASAPATGTTAAYPQQPSNLSVTAASDSQVGLTWADTTGGTAGFTVYRSPTNATGSFAAVGTTAAGVTSYADTGLAEYTNYYYEVAATNAQGSSPLTASQGTTTWEKAPTGLSVTAISAGSVTFSWTNSSARAASVYFQWLVNGNWQGFGPSVSVTPGSNATATLTSSQTNQTFAPSTTYTFRVIASGGYGTPASAAATVTTGSFAQQPSGLTATAASDAQVNLTWTDNSVGTAGFTVYRSPTNASGSFVAIGTTAAGVTGYTDTSGLAENTTYYYQVAATNSVGGSPNTPSTYATTWVKAPTGLTVTAITGGSVTLSWVNASALASYVSFQQLVNGAWQAFGSIVAVAAKGSATPQTIAFTSAQTNQTFAPTTTYTFRVVASGTGSPASAPATGTTGTYPEQPGTLTATASSDSQITLTWADNGGETGFNVYRSGSSAGTYSLLTTVGAGVTTYADAGLTEGTTYYYKVTATNGTGESGTTGVATATTLPKAPTGLTVASISSTSVSLGWTNNSAIASTAYVYQLVNGAWSNVGYLALGTGMAGKTSSLVVAQVFSPSTTYAFRVQVYSTGGYSLPSPVIEATTAAFPAQPTGLTASGLSDSQVNLNWTETSGNQTGFVILRSSSYSGNFTQVGSVGPTARTFADTGLAENNLYYYEVYATSAAGNSAPASPAYAYTTPKAPTGLSATFVSYTQVQLAWTDPSSAASGYYVLQSTDGVNWGSPTYTGGSGTTSYTATGLFNASATYYFRVEAAGSGGYSQPSNTASVAIQPPTIATAASAAPATVTGTTMGLSVLGALAGGAESSLTYTWWVVSGPGTPTTFSGNGTNAAKNVVATLTSAGSYTFGVQVSYGSVSATTTVAVDVEQTLTTIAVAPGGVAVLAGGTQQFIATGSDQFGNTMIAPPTFTWSLGDPTLGTVDGSGLFTAGSAFGPDTVQASAGGITGSVALTVSPVSQAQPLTATAVDSADIALYWLDLPALDNGETLDISTDATFSNGVTSISLATGTTNYTASGLSPATTYYFELLPSAAGSAAVGMASASTLAASTGGGTSPTAPVITSEPTSSQLDGTDVTLTASASSNDPLTYTWQLISAPDGPAPSFDADAETTTAQLFEAGTYEFLVTITDVVTALSAPGTVSVKVDPKATAIQAKPDAGKVAPGGTDKLTATELDQFGHPMSKQPTFSWSVDDPTLGKVGSDGTFTAAKNNVGLATLQAAADGLTGTAPVMVIGSLSINFDDLAGGTVVTNQYPQITVSGDPSYPNQIVGSTDRSGPNSLGAPTPVAAGGDPATGNPYNHPLYVDFKNPVDNLKFYQMRDDAPGGTNIAQVNVFVNGKQVGTVPITSTGAEFTPGLVDLSAYKNVTRIEVTNITDPAGLLWDDFSFDPVAVGLALGDNSAGQIIQASNDGSGHLVPLHLYVPSNLPNGTKVTLSTDDPDQAEVVWKNGSEGGSGSSGLFGGAAGGTSYSWTIGTDTVPDVVYVGANNPSKNVNDFVFKLALTSPDGSDGPSVRSKTATAVRFRVKSLGFGGTGESTIEKDDSSGTYGATDGSATQWNDGDLSGKIEGTANSGGTINAGGEQQDPIAYVRSTPGSPDTVIVTVTFNDALPVGSWVEGLANYDGITFTPHQIVGGDVKADGTTQVKFTANTPLGTTIDSNDLGVTWEFSADNKAYRAEEQTSDHIYVTGAAAANAFETVLWLSCNAAKGCSPANANQLGPATGPQDRPTIDKIWNVLAMNPGNNVAAVHRVDGTLLKYLHLGNSFSTATLLQFGQGSCGAWQDFLVQLLAVQGIGSQKITVLPVAKQPAGYTLIPNDMGIQVGVVPAQGSNGQPYNTVRFTDHALVYVPDYPARIYDPSYGHFYDGANLAAAEQNWEDTNLVDVIQAGTDNGNPGGPLVDLSYAHTKGSQDVTFN